MAKANTEILDFDFAQARMTNKNRRLCIEMEVRVL